MHAEYVFEFLTINDLKNLPRPTWLLDGLIKRGGFAQLHGKEGTWKSFAALNWALSVAAGVDWAHGRATEQGNVVYIIGEGVEEFWPRVEAWLLYHNLHEDAIMDHIRFVPEAVQLVEKEQLAAFIQGVHESLAEPPKLTVVDTLSRAIVGVNENLPEFMTQVIAAVQKIQIETGGAVLVLHHTPYNEERGRGSTALPGALDTIIGIKGKNLERMSAQLYCAKQKNSAEFDPMTIQLKEVGDSLVATFGPVQPLRVEDLSVEMLHVFNTLKRAGPNGLTAEQGSKEIGKARQTFYRYANVLVANGLADKVSHLFIAKEFGKVIPIHKAPSVVTLSHPYRG